MDKNIDISFLTQNEHKYIEAKEALAPFTNIVLEQLACQKLEYKDDSLADPIKTIASRAAKEAAQLYNRIVVAEDAGIFFEAYEDFPSLNTKWVIKRIGYDGIFRLLAGLSRLAYFRSVIALCEPNGEPMIFEGIIRGRISEKVYGESVDCMDYDRIFIPEYSDVPFALIMSNKKATSHRKIAFQKLGEYLSR